jgi:hypothetical protein
MNGKAQYPPGEAIRRPVENFLMDSLELQNLAHVTAPRKRLTSQHSE